MAARRKPESANISPFTMSAVFIRRAATARQWPSGATARLTAAKTGPAARAHFTVRLIKTGEIVSLGMRYDARMPLAPGRAYALRMPGGPTCAPYGGKSERFWNDRVHRNRDRPDRRPAGRARP